ncbi:MAG: ribosome maturation factor RimM [Paucibacter sp.]|nr:ribosome maturation factor RimM [Roseateles sp.]
MSPDSTHTDPAWPEDAVEVGRIFDAWGIKGWVKVQSYSSDASALFASRRWHILPPETNRPGAAKPPAAASAARPIPPVLKILAVRDHGDTIVANIEGIADRNGAESLRGARVFVSRSIFPKPESDEFYWVDLIGLDVVNREGAALGRVIGLLETGPHSVLRIAPPGIDTPKPDEERLVPFVSAYVDAVDLPTKRITVDWGLDF